MTYEERERQICRECRENVKCPYIPRKMEYKCQNLSDTMYGWELGYKDAIDKVHKWINEWDVAYTHPLIMDAVHKELDEFMEEQQ